jgi:hypothetical protein
LPAALRPDLADLSDLQADATTLCATDAVVYDLCWRVARDAKVPFANLNQLQPHLDRCGNELEKLLSQHSRMNVLAQQWDKRPKAWTPETQIADEISGFRGAVTQCIAKWRDPDPKLQMAAVEGCLKVLRLLYAMAVDMTLIHAWEKSSAMHRPVPAASLAAAVNFKAAAADLPMHLSGYVGIHPQFDRVVNVGTTIAGVGRDQIAAVHRQLWQSTSATSLLGVAPGENSAPLEGALLEKLKYGIRDDAFAGTPHMLAHVVEGEAHIPETLRSLSVELDVALTCYSDQGIPPLRFNENQLHGAIRSCLNELQKLK